MPRVWVLVPLPEREGLGEGDVVCYFREIDLFSKKIKKPGRLVRKYPASFNLFRKNPNI